MYFYFYYIFITINLIICACTVKCTVTFRNQIILLVKKFQVIKIKYSYINIYKIPNTLLDK